MTLIIFILGMKLLPKVLAIVQGCRSQVDSDVHTESWAQKVTCGDQTFVGQLCTVKSKLFKMNENTYVWQQWIWLNSWKWASAAYFAEVVA